MNDGMLEVTERFLRGGRWFVRLASGEQQKTMPRANYVWLKGNPSFSEIPKGYVVHHLDLDQTNATFPILSSWQSITMSPTTGSIKTSKRK